MDGGGGGGGGGGGLLLHLQLFASLLTTTSTWVSGGPSTSLQSMLTISAVFRLVARRRSLRDWHYQREQKCCLPLHWLQVNRRSVRRWPRLSRLTAKPRGTSTLLPPPSSQTSTLSFRLSFLFPSLSLYFPLAAVLSLQSPGALSQHYSAQHVFD